MREEQIPEVAAVVAAAREWRDAVRARQAMPRSGDTMTVTYRIAWAEAALLEAVEAMRGDETDVSCSHKFVTTKTKGGALISSCELCGEYEPPMAEGESGEPL